MRMKNKKAEQQDARQKHKASLKAGKRQEPDLDRNEPTLSTIPFILIVCEGENTEKTYFDQFRLSNAIVKTIGEGYNTLSLVERAVELASRKDYDQVWCVFDKDDFLENDFNKAIELAKSHNFGVGYSNQAFEYWIILHFNDHQGGGMHRKDYDKKINSILSPYKCSYDGTGSKIITEEIFDLLEAKDAKTGKSRRSLACERAKRIYALLPHKNPAKEESSTTVFMLVEELAKYL